MYIEPHWRTTAYKKIERSPSIGCRVFVRSYPPLTIASWQVLWRSRRRSTIILKLIPSTSSWLIFVMHWTYWINLCVDRLLLWHPTTWRGWWSNCGAPVFPPRNWCSWRSLDTSLSNSEDLPPESMVEDLTLSDSVRLYLDFGWFRWVLNIWE